LKRKLSNPAASQVQRFLQDLTLQGRTKSTVQNYKSSLIKFFHGTGLHGAKGVTIDHLRDFLENERDQQRLAAKSISKDFCAISSFFDYLEFEGVVRANPVAPFRRRYLKTLARQARKPAQTRDVIGLPEMTRLVHSVADTRDRAIIVLFAKTGVRRQELVNMDVEDIDWTAQSITLKPTPKRTNRRVYFDDETARLLKVWLRLREARGASAKGPLFINQRAGRLNRNRIYDIVTRIATEAGFHNPDGRLNEKLTPHHLRHWFTTHLRRAGMEREDISELRGDVGRETFDIYHHVDHKELRDRYLAKVPKFGI
jgi:integrase/recombinase XerD